MTPPPAPEIVDWVCRPKLPPKVSVDGLAAEPKISVPPEVMLFGMVRAPTVVTGPVNVRLWAPVASVAAKKPAGRDTAFAIVMSPPEGWRIGAVAPEIVSVPVPNGPEVIEPGAPTVLALTRTIG